MQKNKTKKILMILVVCALLISLSSCSKSQSGGGADEYARSAPASPQVSGELYSYDMPAPEMDYYANDMEYDYNETMIAEESGGGFSNTAGAVQDGRKITFSASLSINTKTYDADYRAMNEMIIQTGGYTATERSTDYTQTSGYSTGRSTFISARIPADGYDSFIDRISEIGDVVEKNKWSDDLTSWYFDTEARIEMLELRKERLMEYLISAEEASDIVEFERELSNVLYELDMYQGDKRHLDRLVEFATVDIYLTELITPETIGKDGEPLGDRASDAFSLSMTGVGRFLEGVVVFFAGAAPYLVLIAIIAFIIWLIFRLTRPLREKLRVRREIRAEERAQRVAKQMEKEWQKRAERDAKHAAKRGVPLAQGPYVQPGPYQQYQQPPAYSQPQPGQPGQPGGQGGQDQPGQPGGPTQPQPGQPTQPQPQGQPQPVQMSEHQISEHQQNLDAEQAEPLENPDEPDTTA